jgi:hypothetical protein
VKKGRLCLSFIIELIRRSIGSVVHGMVGITSNCIISKNGALSYHPQSDMCSIIYAPWHVKSTEGIRHGIWSGKENGTGDAGR